MINIFGIILNRFPVGMTIVYLLIVMLEVLILYGGIMVNLDMVLYLNK